MFPIREWFENEKSKKDAEWANRVIRYIRLNDMPLVNSSLAEKGMRYLLGQQDMEFIKELFINSARINLTNERRGALVNGFGQPIRPNREEDVILLKEMASVGFQPLPVMEKIRNILVNEMKRMGVNLNMRADDPTSFARKLQDKDILINKPRIEGLMSYIYTAIGEAPYKLSEHKKRFGTNPANGNIDAFEEMGLSGGDPTDVSFFMEHFHKLDEEIAAESPINFFATYNRLTQEFEKWVNDIMAKKAVAATCWVSNVTGAVMHKYLAPETVWIFGGGNRQDFNDANAKRYERQVTINEMLDMFGDSFDMEKEFNNLLLAITYVNKVEFTGVAPDYRGLMSGTSYETRGGASCDLNQFLTFKVNVGYIEWSSQNQEMFEKVKDTSEGPYEDNQSPTGKYTDKPRWQTPFYKANYLAVSAIDQVLFNFGELPYQDIEGASDVNTAYTIITWKEPGDPITILAAPLIDIMNEAWFKFRYELRRAKPRGRGWNFDSMVSTLMNLIPDTETSSMNKLYKVMEMLDSSANEIYTFPVGPDGQTVMLPGNQLNYDIPNGLSKETMHWWEIIISVGQYLFDTIGISPLREGDPGNARDSMNNQFKALEYSQAATGYVPDTLTALLQQLAVKTNFYVQDIITYKTHNTLPYKFLEDAIGLETLEKLEKLGKTALHRFGIFVETMNQGPLRQKLEALVFEAVKNKTISTAEAMLIEDIKSTKKAFLTFAYFEQRNVRIKQQQAMQMQQQQNEASMAIEQMRYNTEQLRANTELAKAQITVQGNIEVELIKQRGGLDKTVLKAHSDREDIYHQATADILAQQQMNQTGAPDGGVPSAPEISGGGVPSAPFLGEETRAERLRNDIEPMASEADGF